MITAGGVPKSYGFIDMSGFAIGESEFQNGDWIHRLQDLLALPRIERNTSNGADQIAGFISALLKK